MVAATDCELPSVRLSNGVEMPLVGLGTSLVSGRSINCFLSRRLQSSEEEFARLPAALTAALAAGCRLVDTAPVYGTEALVGAALEAAGRRDVFLVSKLPAHASRPAAAARAFERTLRDLRTDVVDLLLVHSPMAVEVRAPSPTHAPACSRTTRRTGPRWTRAAARCPPPSPSRTPGACWRRSTARAACAPSASRTSTSANCAPSGSARR